MKISIKEKIDILNNLKNLIPALEKKCDKDFYQYLTSHPGTMPGYQAQIPFIMYSNRH